ncbi:MAG TPA: MBL fold metallo-hydrolase [Ktedonosporobacter sp.]|nr:MBL fold metallo-hydrolase [Ktedonosporobacter sp.]
MKSTSHGNNLIQLSYWAGFGNCYLVREEDGFTLIDTAVGNQGKAIVQAAQAAGLPIVRIALTHAHGDHIGSLDELHALLPNAEVLVGTREKRLKDGDMSLDPQEAKEKVRGAWITTTTQPTRLLNEGDRVGSLEVFFSPGHTPGHISFLDTRDSTLIAGDAFQTKAGVAVAGIVVPLFPLPKFGTWNLPTALTSAHKLRAQNPTRLATGHGPVLEHPLAVIDRAIEKAARKVGQETPIPAGKA